MGEYPPLPPQLWGGGSGASVHRGQPIPPHPTRSIWGMGAGQQAPAPPKPAKYQASACQPGGRAPAKGTAGSPTDTAGPRISPPRTLPTLSLKGPSCLGSVHVRGSQREGAEPVGRFRPPCRPGCQYAEEWFQAGRQGAPPGGPAALFVERGLPSDISSTVLSKSLVLIFVLS